MRSISVLLVSATLMLSAAASAQRRPSGSEEPEVGVAVDLKVNGTLYTFKGKAAVGNGQRETGAHRRGRHLDVDATTASAARITGTITCDAFPASAAANGN